MSNVVPSQRIEIWADQETLWNIPRLGDMHQVSAPNGKGLYSSIFVIEDDPINGVIGVWRDPAIYDKLLAFVRFHDVRIILIARRCFEPALDARVGTFTLFQQGA